MQNANSRMSSAQRNKPVMGCFLSWVAFYSLAFCLSPGVLGQSVITTVAGNGTAGYSGDGGPAISAQFRELMGLAADSAGNVYAADHWNHRVRKITPDGTVTTIAGTGSLGYSGDGGPATEAQLAQPFDVAVDSAGNLYISDQGNFCIRKVNSAGIISTVAGNGTQGRPSEGALATSASFNPLQGVAVDSLGNILLVDGGEHTVWKVTTGSVLVRVAGGNGGGFSGDGGPARDAMLQYPNYLRIDGAGSLIITDTGNGRIRKVTSDGIITTVAVLPGPFPTAVDDAGNLYVGCQDSRVRKIAPDGSITVFAGSGDYGFSGDGGPALAASMTYPTGLLVSRGRLLINDMYNWRIRAVSLETPLTLGPARFWVGLKNSDDQGTQFDLRVVLYKNSATQLSAGELRCVTGLTRNANLAKQVEITFGSVASGSLNPGDQLTLAVLARIGTNPDGTKCSGPGGSHNNATGLRLYFDGVNQPSGFDAQMTPAPMLGFYLHSPNIFDITAPVAAMAKYKDSTGLNFAAGNPWALVGTWSMTNP